MSQENVEIVRRLYAMFPDRDVAPAEDLVHPDGVFDVSRNVFNPGVHRGLDGFRRFVEQVDEMWEDFRIEPEELIDAGDKVVVRSRMSGKGRESGVETEMQIYGIWEFQEGKVLRFTGGYRDRAEVLKAAGVSE
jgi:ketosteroid isomerase-like protein